MFLWFMSPILLWGHCFLTWGCFIFSMYFINRTWCIFIQGFMPRSISWQLESTREVWWAFLLLGSPDACGQFALLGTDLFACCSWFSCCQWFLVFITRQSEHIYTRLFGRWDYGLHLRCNNLAYLCDFVANTLLWFVLPASNLQLVCVRPHPLVSRSHACFTLGEFDLMHVISWSIFCYLLPPFQIIIRLTFLTPSLTTHLIQKRQVGVHGIPTSDFL